MSEEQVTDRLNTLFNLNPDIGKSVSLHAVGAYAVVLSESGALHRGVILALRPQNPKSEAPESESDVETQLYYLTKEQGTELAGNLQKMLDAI